MEEEAYEETEAKEEEDESQIQIDCHPRLSSLLSLFIYRYDESIMLGNATA